MNDWRLAAQENYLHGVTLTWKRYRAWSESWDHDHCEFCWVTFVDPSDSDAHERLVRDDDALAEGYASVDAGPGGHEDYYWVCERCFNDFHDRFAWRVLSSPDPSK